MLEAYKKSQIPSRIPPPPPSIETDHDVEYEVEEILDSRLQHLLEGLWYQRTHMGTFIQLPESIRQNSGVSSPISF
jgi:hypothetical protein